MAGKFVEFFGEGVSQLSVPDRTTIANMCPEYSATISFFPIDAVALQHFKKTRESPACEYFSLSLLSSFFQHPKGYFPVVAPPFCFGIFFAYYYMYCFLAAI